MNTIAIVGAGPAGLMAAEAALERGARVALYDAMPSPARKLLMAGKSGLNITHSEDEGVFRSRYDSPDGRLAAMVAAFGPAEIVRWMAGLGIETYAGSSGRVFPVGMKASPLLRAWLKRLADGGAVLHVRHRWTGWAGNGALRFETPDGEVLVEADATVLALGGASWPRLGSNGSWTELLAARGVDIEPFAPSNCGFLVAWSERLLAAHEGAPVKRVALSAGGRTQRGEFVVTRAGIEGGAVYPLSAALRREIADRGAAVLAVDLLPDVAEEALAARLAAASPKDSLTNRLRKAARLDPVKIALVHEAIKKENGLSLPPCGGGAGVGGQSDASNEQGPAMRTTGNGPLPGDAPHPLPSTLCVDPHKGEGRREPALRKDIEIKNPAALARLLKALPLPLAGAAPIDRAISTAGGVAWSALDERLQLRAIPGVHCVGEMVAWDAPTGGYLLTACLAMGRWAGERA